MDYMTSSVNSQGFPSIAIRGLLQCTRQTSVDMGGAWCKLSRSGTNLTKETCHMSIQAHLAELERRHQALENEISEALTHPSTDDLKVAELKRRKLQVKDEIARLRVDVSVH
jgi:hypothetical protein